jgi:putative ABC transport system permease protein
LRLSLIGALIGLGLAFAATRILTAQLYGVGSRDPLVFASVAVALVLVAILAAYIPARRASRVDPIVALRND